MEDTDDTVKGDMEDPHKYHNDEGDVEDPHIYHNDEGDVEDADPPATD